MTGLRDRIHSWRKSFSVANPEGLNVDESRDRASKASSFEDYDALPPVTLKGFSDKTKNRLMKEEMCDELRQLMPLWIQLSMEWTLLYSLEQHGASLHSLYDNIKFGQNSNARVGYVLVIRDRKGGIFGGYVNEPFHPTDGRRYYGNGECFLWKLDRVPDIHIRGHSNTSESHIRTWQLKGYPYTGLNEFSIYCTSEFLSMGAGDGHYGLWCDNGLNAGVTSPCLTFGNEILSREGSKFHITGLEVWRVG